MANFLEPTTLELDPTSEEILAQGIHIEFLVKQSKYVVHYPGGLTTTL